MENEKRLIWGNEVSVKLTDDELCNIMTALHLTLEAINMKMKLHGEHSVDFMTKKLVEDIKVLHDKLEKEYF